MNTYKIEAMRSDVNAAGGQSAIIWIVRAPGPHEALRLVSGISPRIVDTGPHLDADAKKLGVRDGDAKSQ